MIKKEKEWYGARTAYRVIIAIKKPSYNLYEDRIIVLQAISFDKAIQEAEKEAKSYAKTAGCKYLGFISVFQLFGNDITNKTEVYSSMRDSRLSEEKYLDKYFDTGKERTKQ